jgi:Nucleotidyl transferase of unknown function (DUF2204)
MVRSIRRFRVHTLVDGKPDLRCVKKGEHSEKIMAAILHHQTELDQETRAFYCQAMEVLERTAIPFLVGGAYALARYTGITRHTKDFDLFLRRADCELALAAFARQGWSTDLTFPHWLAKVYRGENYIDLIFSSGNGLVEVDDDWFKYSVAELVLDREVKLIPPEEMIWSKGFIMERERYDGADIHHLLRTGAATLDWARLLRRFGSNWRLLLTHLILFGYTYPAERLEIPTSVMILLLERLQEEQMSPPPPERVCQGTFLSRSQYLMDIQLWGYQDPRLRPQGKMSPEAIAHWTAAIGNDHPCHEQ